MTYQVSQIGFEISWIGSLFFLCLGGTIELFDFHK